MAIGDWQTYTTAVSSVANTLANPDAVILTFVASGFVAFRPCFFQLNTSAGYTDFSAEL